MDFEIISQDCSLDDPLPKIAQMVPLRQTKWPPELKVETPINDILS